MALTPEKIEEIKKELMGLEGEEQQKKLQEVLATLSPEEREQLVGKQECPFCSMATGKIPVTKVYEDDKILGILDINPANAGHVLLFPKEHANVLAEVPDKIVREMFSIANKLAINQYEKLGAKGTNIVVANGAIAGQTAPHAIINIIPRFEGDKVAVGWERKQASEDELKEIAGKIKVKKEVKVHEVKVTEAKEEEVAIP
tara:strand:+ start:182 stop:784 length:603 start_codon:yes stop_codon:yes gene_type:complete